MPVDMDMLADTFQEHLIDLRTRLKPAIVVCIGPPIASIPQTLHQLFPTIRIFVVSEDARHLRLEEANDSSSSRERALKAVGAFHDMFRTYCLNTLLQDPPIEFRYRLHRNHMLLQTFLPGQRLYILKAITSAGHSIESSVWLSDRHFQQPAILDECVSRCQQLQGSTDRSPLVLAVHSERCFPTISSINRPRCAPTCNSPRYLVANTSGDPDKLYVKGCLPDTPY